MQERPVDAHRCHDGGRATVVTMMARENKRPGRWWDSRLRRGVSRKDVLTLSPILTGRSLHCRYYCWFFTSRATPNVMLLGFSEVESSLPNRHSLFLSSLSCLSLVSFSLVLLVSLTHSYRRIYICFIATENSSVFNLCCTELVQHNHIHSIR